MSAHTPAPWRIGDAGLTVFGPPNGNSSPETVAATRNRANARLIAAAPDLLKALRALASTARTFRNVPKEEQEWTSIDDDALKAAFAAIAKATGGAA